MSETMTEAVKRWTAKRKSALLVQIIQVETTVAEASRTFDLAPSEIESWVDDAKKGMENPSFGYRTVAHLLGFNKNTVQRVFQIKGWQVRRRPSGARPRIEALPSVAEKPNER